ncbi:MAG TPA: universal stress protein [Planctomycetaceae bacterium]|jgi:nucleotide-binding universal stress UspA family protein|nr:universal stress protein [Planctomycetaceae bacterium]
MAWFPRSKVVVPIDFSEASQPAVEAAREMVAQPEDLHVLHVLVPLDYAHPGALTPAFDEKERLETTRRHLAEFLARHRLAEAHAIVRLGDPGLDITDYAAEIQADLIVIPSHGYHGMKRFLLGSTAERVIRHAACPVLVLRRPDAE